MNLGERIKESRKRKGLTQRQLADLIGVKHNSISNWENNQNKPDPDTLELLCGALDVSPSYLLGYNSYSSEKKMTNFHAFIHEFEKYESIYNIRTNQVEIFLESEPGTKYVISAELYNDFLEFTQQRIETEFEMMLKRSQKIIAKNDLKLVLNAAHDEGATAEQKVTADAIMTDDSEWE